MVSAIAKARIDALLASLAVPFPHPEDPADVAWEDWMELVAVDSALAGVLISLGGGGETSNLAPSEVAECRRLLTRQEASVDVWTTRRVALTAACDLLDELAAGEV